MSATAVRCRSNLLVYTSIADSPTSHVEWEQLTIDQEYTSEVHTTQAGKMCSEKSSGQALRPAHRWVALPESCQ